MTARLRRRRDDPRRRGLGRRSPHGQHRSAIAPMGLQMLLTEPARRASIRSSAARGDAQLQAASRRNFLIGAAAGRLVPRSERGTPLAPSIWAVPTAKRDHPGRLRTVGLAAAWVGTRPRPPTTSRSSARCDGWTDSSSPPASPARLPAFPPSATHRRTDRRRRALHLARASRSIASTAWTWPSWARVRRLSATALKYREAHRRRGMPWD